VKKEKEMVQRVRKRGTGTREGEKKETIGDPFFGKKGENDQNESEEVCGGRIIARGVLRILSL